MEQWLIQKAGYQIIPNLKQSGSVNALTGTRLSTSGQAIKSEFWYALEPVTGCIPRIVGWDFYAAGRTALQIIFTSITSGMASKCGRVYVPFDNTPDQSIGEKHE